MRMACGGGGCGEEVTHDRWPAHQSAFHKYIYAAELRLVKLRATGLEARDASCQRCRWRRRRRRMVCPVVAGGGPPLAKCVQARQERGGRRSGGGWAGRRRRRRRRIFHVVHEELEFAVALSAVCANIAGAGGGTGRASGDGKRCREVHFCLGRGCVFEGRGLVCALQLEEAGGREGLWKHH